MKIKFVIHLIVFTLMVGMVIVPVVAGASNDHVLFVGDRTDNFADSDIYMFAPDGTFLKSLKSTMPVGTQMYFDHSLRWGSDGHLYNYGRFKDANSIDPNKEQYGVFEWSKSGNFMSFHGSDALTGQILGFELTPNNDFLLVDISAPGDARIREYSRDFSTYQQFTTNKDYTPDEEAVRIGNNLYVTGAGEVTISDILTRSQTGHFDTFNDISKINASNGGKLVVPDQWSNPNDGIVSQIRVFDTSGNMLYQFGMNGKDSWLPKGVAFWGEKTIYVGTKVSDPSGDISQVSIFNYDNISDNYVYTGSLGSAYLKGDPEIATVPEPSSILALGVLTCGLLCRFRKKR